jgi:DNA-directed RNA polymerase sigma subunit (sigma70/sigma32)
MQLRTGRFENDNRLKLITYVIHWVANSIRALIAFILSFNKAAIFV